MKTRNNYQDIRTLDDLDGAIRRNRARIAEQGSAVGDSFGQVQTFYTPQNLALQGVRKFALDKHLYTIGINLVRALKNLIR